VAGAAGGFIGRKADIERLHALLSRGERLVTIVGPGGIGKTALALHYVQARRDSRPASVVCSLADARDLDAFCVVVARALGVVLTPMPPRDPAAHLARAIAGRGDALLILDNFEQLPKTAAESVGGWLDAAPRARFLVTSRERLRLPGEVVHELGPLSLPGDAVAMEASEAVALWHARVEATRPGHTPTSAEADDVSAIVRQLDGLPLAIELCAARANVLGTRALLERLSERFALLSHGATGAQARHRTLRTTIDWSWDLLEPWERAALAQSSVFRGGFTLQAAEGVLDLRRFGHAPPVLDVVQALRDKSLLTATAQGGGAGELRLGSFASIRDYAAIKLGRGPARQTAFDRHAAHYVAFAESRASELLQGGHLAPFLALAADRENIEAVAERADASTKRSAVALRALLALNSVARKHGPLASYLATLDAAIASARSAPRDLEARAHAVRGDVRRLLGQMPEALRDIKKAEALGARSAAELRAFISGKRGALHLSRGELEHAERAYTRQREISRGAALHLSEALALADLGSVAHAMGRLDEAEQDYRDAAARCRKLGARFYEPTPLHGLGLLCLERGDHHEARRYFGLVDEICRDIGDRHTQAMLSGFMGDSYFVEGQLAQAQVHYERAAGELRAVGARRYEGLVEGYLGMIEQQLGRWRDALGILEGAVAKLMEVEDHLYGAMLYACIASSQAALDRLADAEDSMARARRLLDPGSLGARAVVSLQGAHLDLARARRAGRQGDAEARAAHVRRAVRVRESADPKVLAQSMDARNAARLLDLTLAELVAGEGAGPSALEVDARGRWARLPDGARVELGSRAALGRLLLALAQQRVAARGRAIPAGELISSVWRGERVSEDAAQNRLYVTLTRLRKHGFGDLIRSTREGYLLDPDVPMRIVPDLE
jgi:predicted ATPase